MLTEILPPSFVVGSVVNADVLDHSSSDSPSPSCHRCKQKFANWENCKRHIKQRCEPAGYFECRHCHQKSQRPHQARDHHQKYHDGICGDPARCKELEYRPVRAHYALACNICGQQFFMDLPAFIGHWKEHQPSEDTASSNVNTLFGLLYQPIVSEFSTTILTPALGDFDNSERFLSWCLEVDQDRFLSQRLNTGGPVRANRRIYIPVVITILEGQPSVRTEEDHASYSIRCLRYLLERYQSQEATTKGLDRVSWALQAPLIMGSYAVDTGQDVRRAASLEPESQPCQASVAILSHHFNTGTTPQRVAHTYSWAQLGDNNLSGSPASQAQHRIKETSMTIPAGKNTSRAMADVEHRQHLPLDSFHLRLQEPASRPAAVFHDSSHNDRFFAAQQQSDFDQTVDLHGASAQVSAIHGNQDFGQSSLGMESYQPSPVFLYNSGWNDTSFLTNSDLNSNLLNTAESGMPFTSCPVNSIGHTTSPDLEASAPTRLSPTRSTILIHNTPNATTDSSFAEVAGASLDRDFDGHHPETCELLEGAVLPEFLSGVEAQNATLGAQFNEQPQRRDLDRGMVAADDVINPGQVPLAWGKWFWWRHSDRQAANAFGLRTPIEVTMARRDGFIGMASEPFVVFRPDHRFWNLQCQPSGAGRWAFFTEGEDSTESWAWMNFGGQIYFPNHLHPTAQQMWHLRQRFQLEMRNGSRGEDPTQGIDIVWLPDMPDENEFTDADFGHGDLQDPNEWKTGPNERLR